MEFIKKAFFIISHLHKYIDILVNTLGVFSYLVLFTNMVLETGGLILGFLPGDSLVVAAAAYTSYAPDRLNIFAVFLTVLIGTFLGDCMSFHIGKFVGRRYTSKSQFKFINKEQYDMAHNFFMKNGRKAFFINRFIPFARAWLPFTAGFTKADYKYIAPINFCGCLLWTSVYTIIGYFFGNQRFVRNNFSIILVIVMVISSVPAAIVLFINRHKIKKTLSKNEKNSQNENTIDSKQDEALNNESVDSINNEELAIKDSINKDDEAK